MKDNILFDGYVLTREKTSITPFKTRNTRLSYRDVVKSESFGGVLAAGTILIDVDDLEQAEKLLAIVKAKNIKCLVYNTTRGKHFILNNSNVNRCMTNVSLACGINKVDIKVGVQYCILKINGKFRDVVWDKEPDDKYDFLPGWMYPVKTNKNFTDLHSGEGRNSELFKYVTYLRQHGFSEEDTRESIRIINEYVFSESLSNQELDSTVLRDDYVKNISTTEYADSSSTFFNNRGKFLFNKFATYIMDNYSLSRINGDLFFYKDGAFHNSQRILERIFIELVPELNATQRTEVYKYLDLLVHNNIETNANYICCENGTIDIKTGVLEKWSPTHHCVNKIDIYYNPYAECEEVDKMLDSLLEKSGDGARELIEEILGYVLYRRNEFRKAIVLIGEHQSGKSTFLTMLQHFIGQENCSYLDLNELDQRFKTSELSGKLVNIGDDISHEYISNPAMFKKLVTGNPVTVERKGQNPFPLYNYAKLIFSANEMPRIREKGGSIESRLLLVPFYNKFSKEDGNIDRELIDKLITTEAKQYLFAIAIKGLQRLLMHGEFTTPESVEALHEEYRLENDSVLSFLTTVDEDVVIGETVNGLYANYEVYCSQDGLKPCGKTVFTKKVCSALSLKANRHWDAIKEKQVRRFERSN